MDLTQGLLLITSVHLLAAASPGPDFVLVSQQTLSNGRRAGQLSSAGIALGLSVHILYSSLGLAAVIANSSSALWGIKLLGGGYLVYLGITGLRARASTNIQGQLEPTQANSSLKILGMGFLCNALNPKAPIYFVSLFTIVLSQDTPAQHLLIYGLWMMVLQLAWFSFLTLLLSKPQVTSKFHRMGHWIDRVTGGAMLILGLKVLATRTQ
ncbi:MAG: LysE family transporter [Porticoccaceae bacterium]|jgi:RhtB (resistance to homoserine/threonine) family protein|nr:LysE family transporter [Porticoccaceae bacterium]MBT5578149.1 LysE family transporter [Porticoccaceae bacterium]MBT7376180.1 LysE family transporter [Porticoccaceae bacterium]